MRTWTNMLYVMFNKRAALFYRFKITSRRRAILDPVKHLLRVY